MGAFHILLNSHSSDSMEEKMMLEKGCLTAGVKPLRMRDVVASITGERSWVPNETGLSVQWNKDHRSGSSVDGFAMNCSFQFIF